MAGYSAARTSLQDLEDAIDAWYAMKAAPSAFTLEDAAAAQAVAMSARDAANAAVSAAIQHADNTNGTRAIP